jgi:large subunit ribosomal protein L18
MKEKRKVIPFRRKREGKTNYKKRIAYLTSGVPRLVIRKSLKNVTVQLIMYEPKGDKVLACSSSYELKKLGWKNSGCNMPAAYLVGFLAGKKAKEKRINGAVVDFGLNRPTTDSIYTSALKGAIDAGLNIPHNAAIIPKKERIEGKHIADYRKIDIPKQFNEMLQKIKGAK